MTDEEVIAYAAETGSFIRVVVDAPNGEHYTMLAQVVEFDKAQGVAEMQEIYPNHGGYYVLPTEFISYAGRA